LLVTLPVTDFLLVSVKSQRTVLVVSRKAGVPLVDDQPDTAKDKPAGKEALTR
jgi:hypothetical protein